MKKLFRILTNMFKRYEIVDTIKLSTGLTCIHTLDKWNNVIRITTDKCGN